MPRFSNLEKEAIRCKLLEQGEKLFTKFGIKKVTIEDLTKVVGIASGSFYSFFDSKESLYLEINMSKQNQIFASLNDELGTLGSTHLSKKEKCIYLLKILIEKFQQEPILTMLDTETWSYLSRKVPDNLLEKHLRQDVEMVSVIIQQGAKLRYSQEQTAKLIQALFMIVKEALSAPDYADILDIIIDSIVNQAILD